MKLNIAKSISAIHTLHININIVLYVVQAKKKECRRARPTSLSLSKKLAASIGVTSILYIFCSTQLSQQKMVRPLLLLRGRTRRIYICNFKYWFFKRCREWCQPFFARCKDNTHALATKAQRSGPNPMHFFALYTKQLWTESLLLLLVQPFFKNHTVGYRLGKTLGGKTQNILGSVFRVE